MISIVYNNKEIRGTIHKGLFLTLMILVSVIICNSMNAQTISYETFPVEQDIVLEAWMVSANDIISTEEDIVLQSWMIVSEDLQLAELEMGLESWMWNDQGSGTLDLADATEQLALEDWMIDLCAMHYYMYSASR